MYIHTFIDIDREREGERGFIRMTYRLWSSSSDHGCLLMECPRVQQLLSPEAAHLSWSSVVLEPWRSWALMPVKERTCYGEGEQAGEEHKLLSSVFLYRHPDERCLPTSNTQIKRALPISNSAKNPHRCVLFGGFS